MTTVFTFIFSILISQTIFASAETCINKVTQDNRYDSRSLTFNADEYVFENDHVGDSYNLIRLFIERKGCGRKDIRFTAGPGSVRSGKAVCNNVAKGYHHSRVCYVESNIGFFFVMRDMMNGATVVYNRWD